MEWIIAGGSGGDVGRISAEIGRRLVQAGTNAVTQFLGGRLGEGDDQDLRWRMSAQGGWVRDLVSVKVTAKTFIFWGVACRLMTVSARGILLIIPWGVTRGLLLESPQGIP